MYGPDGEQLDQDSDGDGREEFPRKAAYQIPGVSPVKPPDVIKQIIKSGGSTARRMRRQGKHIIDRDNRASG